MQTPSSSRHLHFDFLDAAHMGHLRDLQNALALGADPLEPSPTQISALHLAASEGHVDCCALLLPLSNPNQPDQDGRSALHWAVISDQPQCLSLLLPVSDPNYPDHQNLTPLHWAASFGHIKCVQLLLPVSDLTLQDSNGMTPLSLAQANNQPDCALLIQAFLLMQEEHSLLGQQTLLASASSLPKIRLL